MTSKLYRIYTEEKNRAEVEAVTGDYFPGFTVFTGIGYYKGNKEFSMVIEIIGNDTKKDFEKIVTLAEYIKTVNCQESVLITTGIIKLASI